MAAKLASMRFTIMKKDEIFIHLQILDMTAFGYAAKSQLLS